MKRFLLPSIMMMLLVASADFELFAAPSTADDEKPPFENLQVLPKGISRDALLEVMLENLHGLGLPRLAGKGCLYCHVGDLDRPRREWDYASDDNPMKAKARTMMAMVAAINDQHLAKLGSRIAPDLRVTCTTCHAGRTDPRPIIDVLTEAYETGGVDALEQRYRALRADFFGGDAYDFRPRVLSALATRLADQGERASAERVAAFNAEMNPSAADAKQTWVWLVLEGIITDPRAKEKGGANAIAELAHLAPTLATDVLTPSLLDGLGWRLYRRDQGDAAMALFRHNRERFPDEYIPLESLAFVLSDTGDLEGAFGILEAWLERHPDHDRARRLVINLRSPK